ncbi:MAG TPA: hypothetical protein VF626_00565 [Chthoniobacterales bacterium]
MRPFKNVCVVLACASLLLGQFGCKTIDTLTTSTEFSQAALTTDTQLKAASLALIDRAKNKAPYTGVATDVDALMAQVDSAIAAEQTRTKNAPTIAQWKKIKEQLTTLFALWKSKGTLSPAFVDDSRKQVGNLFDILIKTENDKRASS